MNQTLPTGYVHGGSCHCGAVGFQFASRLPPAQWSVRACQCRFCRAHDAISSSDPAGELAFRYTEPTQLQRYRFALQTADFLLCRRCGVYIGAVIDTPHGNFGIINTHALQQQPTDLPAATPISYASEDSASRVSRRAERWTPVSVG